METLEQFEIPLTRKVKLYCKGSRHDIIEDVYHNKILEVIHYRCRSCGEFKSASKDERCPKCITQLELF